MRSSLASDHSYSEISVGRLICYFRSSTLQEEIQSRRYFYRSSQLIQSGVLRLENSYNYSSMSADIVNASCHLDTLVLDHIAGLDVEIGEFLESARCLVPRVDIDAVVIPDKQKNLVLRNAMHFDTFRKVRKEVGLDDIVRYGRGLTLLFHGRSGTGKTLFANALAAHMNKKMLVVDFPAGTKNDISSEDFHAIFREARIHDALLFIDECDDLLEGNTGYRSDYVNVALRELETFDGILVLATNRPTVLDDALERRISLSVKFDMPDAVHRLRIWESHLPPTLQLADDVALWPLAVEFELTGGLIKNAVFQALACAVSRAKEKQTESEDATGTDESILAKKVIVCMADLREACRLQARGNIKRSELFSEEQVDGGLDLIITTTRVRASLEELLSTERMRNAMASRWGFSGGTRSTCALFVGPAGTGKTRAAYCLASELGRPAVRITARELLRLDEMRGPHSGETYSVKQTMDQASVEGAVIVVEGAEKLFYAIAADLDGSVGTDAFYHVRRFNGLVLMCCTTEDATHKTGWPKGQLIPGVVSAGLSHFIAFEIPDVAMRLALWGKLLPVDMPVRKGVREALDGIARRYEMSGGMIEGAIRRAAAFTAMRDSSKFLMAAKEDGESLEVGVSLKDIEKACEAEMRVSGQSFAYEQMLHGMVL